ncbi:hypothetical protein [Sulfurimonas sp.]
MNRQENFDELRAKQYLQTLKYKKLEYEPLGNVTPDFVIDNKIAIEVRRLNKNYISNEKLVHIEDTEIPLVTKNIEELHENIQLVIDEKNKKIEKNFNLYDEWWLILVDYITHAISSEDFEKVKKMKLNKHKFTRVIILSPDGDFKAFKL